MILVRKRRKLIKARYTEPSKKNVTAEETGSRRDATGQEVGEPSGKESATIPGATQSGDWGEEGQAALPLVLVPFEDVSKRNQQPEGSRQPSRGGCRH